MLLDTIVGDLLGARQMELRHVTDYNEYTVQKYLSNLMNEVTRG